ncbi:putative pectin lyase/virulence factor [Helianthus annuus]|nr:putative pectin lyase/virulence factor [Helianthus annuus]
MGDFSFRKLIFAFVIVTLVWASSIETCNARRGGKHWRQSRGTLNSLYKKKGKNDHGHKKQKSKQEQQQQQPLPTPEEPLAPPQKGSKFNVLDYGAKGDGHSDDTKVRYNMFMHIDYD